MSISTSRGARLVAALLVGGVLVAGACSSDDAEDDAPATTEAAAAGRSVDDASAEELEQWQTDLNAVGCWSGAVDGEMGPQTEEAIEEFQAAEGLTVDGLLGPATESALTSAVDAGTTVCSTSSDTTATTSGGSDTTGTTFDPDPATNGTDQDSLEEYVARIYVDDASQCDPPVYDGPVSGVGVEVASFVPDESANGTAGPDVTTGGGGSVWEATYTDGEWQVDFAGICGSG